jgi:integrase
MDFDRNHTILGRVLGRLLGPGQLGGHLSALGVKVLTKPGRHGDGRGLHLHVRSSGSRAWVLRYMRDGKSTDLGLGPYPDVSLAEARSRADAARALLRDDLDPLAARKKAKIDRRAANQHTFHAAALQLIADKGAGWRNPKHRAQWVSSLEAYAFPVFGHWPIQQVDSEAVMRVLRPLWERVPETASRLRGRIEAVIDAARAQGWFTGENPARWKGHLASRLPSARKVKAQEHFPSLAWRELPAFLRALRLREGVAVKAIEFAVLTAARSGEVRGMVWGEVDFETAIWTIPAARMKAARMHRVPLSSAAVELLRSMVPLASVNPSNATPRPAIDQPVFTGMKSRKPLSDMSLSAMLRRMNETAPGGIPPWRDAVSRQPITVHGFRSTFRVWAGEETRHPREVIEAALAHSLRDKVEAAYQRSDLIERRRTLLAGC